MPTEYIPDNTGRYVRLKWRRDQREPGCVQIATGAPGVDGEFVDLDGPALDKLIKAAHKAKNQVFATSAAEPAPRYAAGGPVPTVGPFLLTPPCGEVTVESDATAASRLDTDRYRGVRRGNR